MKRLFFIVAITFALYGSGFASDATLLDERNIFESAVSYGDEDILLYEDPASQDVLDEEEEIKIMLRGMPGKPGDPGHTPIDDAYGVLLAVMLLYGFVRLRKRKTEQD